MLNANWSAFLKGIFQSHDWNSGTNEGCQLGSGDLGLLPLAHWCVTGHCVGVMAGFLLPPTQPHPNPMPIPPTPSISNTDIRKGWQKS